MMNVLLVLLFWTGPDPWSLMAQRDLEAMHAQIVANHPGSVDPENPNFGKWVEEGFRAAMTKAAEVNSFGGYAAALRFYGAGFRDGHLNVGTTISLPKLWWPGFLVALRNDKYIVSATAPDDASLPPMNAELVDCDGRTPRQILEEDVWPYLQGPKLDNLWAPVASALLLDRGNPWMKRARSCRFRAGDEVKTLDVRYRETTSEDVSRMLRTTVAVREPLPPARSIGDGVWVSIPGFDDSDPALLARLKNLVELAPSWRNTRFVVFDVRGNGGGNSYWGNEILKALYGEGFYEPMVDRLFARQYVDWRVSPANIEHVKGIAANVRERAGADAAKRWEAIAEGMSTAQAKGQKLFHMPDEAEPETRAGEPLFKGKVFLVTDSQCGSACLDFVDRIRALPNATHTGLTTNADSLYMEVRSLTLPSGIARLGLPTKVYRNRPRGHNQPYEPQIVFNGDLNDTAAVERWIGGLTR